MRSVIKLVILLSVLSVPSWSLACLQGGAGCTNTSTRQAHITSGTSTTITVAATTAGAVGVLCAAMDGNLTLSSTSAGGFTSAAASKGNDATLAGSVQCLYNLNETGGVTSITCTYSSTTGGKDCFYVEFSMTSPTFDVAGIQDNTTACTTACTAVALSTTTSNTYALVQVAYCGGTCSALSQSYTFAVTSAGDGTGFKINTGGAGTTPNWTQSPSARLLSGAVAIYETSGATTTNKPKGWVM